MSASAQVQFSDDSSVFPWSTSGALYVTNSSSFGYQLSASNSVSRSYMVSINGFSGLSCRVNLTYVAGIDKPGHSYL